MQVSNYILLFLQSLWNITLEMSPYLILGFVFAGLLHILIPQKIIIRFMGKSNFKSVLYSAILGVPLPLCSCGVIPTGVSLYNNGASKGATVSFLISTPQTGVDSIMISYSLLGLPFALIRPIVAFVTGITGGIITNIIDKKPIVLKTVDSITINENNSKKENVFKRFFNYAFIVLLGDIAKWLIVGLALAALIDIAIPENFFSTYIHNELLSMLIILVIAVPLYVCATSSVPIAAMLMLKGLSPGAALVFLMAGPATNAATITVLSKIIGKKSLFAYLFAIIVGSFGFGLLINTLPREWFILPALSVHAKHMGHHMLPMWLTLTSTIFLIIMIIYNFYLMYFKHKNYDHSMDNTKSNAIVYKVEGMTCSHCKTNVENSLKSIEGIQSVNANNITGDVEVVGNVKHIDIIKNAIEKAGYTFKGTR